MSDYISTIISGDPQIKSLLMFFASLIFNMICALPFINLLYKHKFYKTTSTEGVDTSKRNPLWYKHLGKTLGKPSSYGLLLIPNIVLYALTIGKNISTVTGATILFFVAFALLGLWDDVVKYFYYLKNKSWGLRAYQKLLIQLGGFFVAVFLIFPNDIFVVLLGSLLGVFILNSYNITDGLDGLVGSITLLILPILMIFEYLFFGFSQFFYLYVILFAFFVVFVYFNIKPARVTFGDVGTMGMGFLLGITIFRYPLIPVMILFSLILIEGISSFIQIVSIKYLKKKVFLIAPLHLHLLNKGWEDTKIVQRAWVFQIVVSLLSVSVVKLLG